MTHLKLNTQQRSAILDLAEQMRLPFLNSRKADRKLAILWALVEQDGEFSSHSMAKKASNFIQRSSISSSVTGHFLGMMFRKGLVNIERIVSDVALYKQSEEFNNKVKQWRDKYENIEE
tara:strand:- start:3148 stop:3504 length:357 start_codon:yes stop_codon:yes gene_type:complete